MIKVFLMLIPLSGVPSVIEMPDHQVCMAAMAKQRIEYAKSIRADVEDVTVVCSSMLVGKNTDHSFTGPMS